VGEPDRGGGDGVDGVGGGKSAEVVVPKRKLSRTNNIPN